MLKRKKGRSKRAQLIRKLDRLAPVKCKERDHYICQRCGSRPAARGLHSHHAVIGRSDYRTRWDLDNLVCLDYGCHRWAHSNGALFAEWFKEKYPERVSSVLAKTQGPPRTLRLADLEAIYEHLSKL